jgi:RHS repeat-associated protein
MEKLIHNVARKMKRLLVYFSLLILDFGFSAELAERSLAYDANGNISGYTVPHAGEVVYSYDPINRLTEICYPNGETVKYFYDYNSNLTEVAWDIEITFYSYDALNRLVKARLPENTTLSYEYDLAGRIIKITYPDQEEVKYNYDDRGRLIQVFDQTGNTQYEYDDETNLVAKEKLPNGIVTEYTYDILPRITGVSHRKSDGILIAEYQFTYDGNNNCTSAKEKTPSELKNTTYSYDKLNRLIEATCSDNSFERYTYDGAGNCLIKTTQNDTINYEYDNYNRLMRAGDTYYYYDATGNLTKKVSRGKEVTLGYDDAGRLISYDDGENKVAFTYDGEGRRISKTVNGEKTSFINDPVGPLSRVLLEKDEHGQTQKRYVYGLSRLSWHSPANTFLFLYDQPGKSVSILVDNDQKILEAYQYSAFGLKKEKGCLANPYSYAGEEYDEETGLIYLRNRYYDPEVGRFISPDSVLGVLGDPQSLNPYVYVRNSPINYIDPSGLYAVKVPLTFYGNFPGARTTAGKSRAGHGWIGGVSINGNEFTQGAWPGPGEKMHYDENVMSLCKETVSFTVWIAPEIQMLARQAGNYPHWSAYNNCIDHVAKSLDAIGYPHPSFKASPIGISDPAIYSNWIIREKNHINPKFLPGNDDIAFPAHYFDPPKFQNSISWGPSLFFQPNYGGVSLSKAAELMTNISDIDGAVFDQKTGQIILYGTKDLSLPRMHLDDLVVAVRSVYGLGGKPAQDPGVSMEPDPHPPKKNNKPQPRMVITYYGETKDTHFGLVMFEADRLLKNLMIGRDNYTGKKFKAHLHGYQDLLYLYRQEKEIPFPITSRMWFVPQKISLVQSEDGTSMMFDKVHMQVLTESKFFGNTYYDHAAEKFSAHFTQNYDGYANEFPILHELKRLGKITGVVKWIKEKNLPFDLSFFKNYSPQFIGTPTYTPQVLDIEQGIIMSGGVTYHLSDSNFSITSGWQANVSKTEVLQARPTEVSFSWDFGERYTAVAQSFGKTLKVGDVKKAFTDMSFPVPGICPLTLVRTYDSFNEESSGFGLGWDATPAKLRIPNEKQYLRFSDDSILKLYAEIFVSVEGIEVLYRIAGLDAEKRPLYRSERGASLLFENIDGTFSFSRKHEELLFNSQGKLVKICDRSGVAIDYLYDEKKLVSISHQGKKIIHLEYEGPTIARAIGLGGKIIYYDYTPEGQLKSVRDREGPLSSYSYDKDLHLSAIFDAKGSKCFEANYDIYNRAEEQSYSGTNFKQGFSLSERRARVEGANGFFLEETFDEKYRPEKIINALGRTLELVYGSSFGPEKTVDNNGLEVFYEYDKFGHPLKIKDAYNGERYYRFDDKGNLLAEMDGRRTETAYRYDEKGRLIKIYRPYYLSCLAVENGKTITGGDERYVTSFNYDPTTGNLESVEFPGGGKEIYGFDENGLPIQVSYSNGLASKRIYDDRSRLVELCEMGRSIQYTYDGRDRITKISLPLGEIHYSYDPVGNVLSKTDPLGLISTFAYDENDNLTQTTDALGGTSSYEYNPYGDLIKITLPNGSIREIRYDQFSRPIALK